MKKKTFLTLILVPVFMYLGFCLYIFTLCRINISKNFSQVQNISFELNFINFLIPIVKIKTLKINDYLEAYDLELVFTKFTSILLKRRVDNINISKVRLIMDNQSDKPDHRLFPQIYMFFFQLEFLQNASLKVEHIEFVASELSKQKIFNLQKKFFLKFSNKVLSCTSIDEGFYFKLDLSQNPQNSEITNRIVIELMNNLIEIYEIFLEEKLVSGKAFIKMDSFKFFKMICPLVNVGIAKYLGGNDTLSIFFDIKHSDDKLSLENIKGKASYFEFVGNLKSGINNSNDELFLDFVKFNSGCSKFKISDKHHLDEDFILFFLRFLFRNPNNKFLIYSKFPHMNLGDGIYIGNFFFEREIKDNKSKIEGHTSINSKNKIHFTLQDLETINNHCITQGYFNAEGPNIDLMDQFLQKFSLYCNPISIYQGFDQILWHNTSSLETNFRVHSSFLLGQNFLDVKSFQLSTKDNFFNGRFFLTDKNVLVLDTKLFKFFAPRLNDKSLIQVLKNYLSRNSLSLSSSNFERKKFREFLKKNVISQNIDVQYFIPEQNEIVHKSNWEIRVAKELMSLANISSYSAQGDRVKFYNSGISIIPFFNRLKVNLNFSQISFTFFQNLIKNIVQDLDLKDFNFRLNFDRFLVNTYLNIKYGSLFGHISGGILYLDNVSFADDQIIQDLSFDNHTSTIRGSVTFKDYNIKDSHVIKILQLHDKIYGNADIKGDFAFSNRDLKLEDMCYNIDVYIKKLAISEHLFSILSSFFVQLISHDGKTDHMILNKEEKTVSSLKMRLSLKGQKLEIQDAFCEIFNFGIKCENVTINLFDLSIKGQVYILNKKFNINHSFKLGGIISNLTFTPILSR